MDEEKSTRLKHYKELASSNRIQTNAECERNCPPHETACHWIIQYQLVSPKIIHTSNFIMTGRLSRVLKVLMKCSGLNMLAPGEVALLGVGVLME